MQSTEPEFDSEQRAYVLALAELQSDTGSYGELLSEATSEEANPNNYDFPLRFVGKGPFTNWAVKAVEDAQDAYRASLGDAPQPNGQVWVVEKLGA